MRRSICAVLALIMLICPLLCACGGEYSGPQVGSWHADIKINDLDTGSLSSSDNMLLKLLGENIIFEINVDFSDDGTFVYKIDTDSLEKSISDAANAVLGSFSDFDASALVNTLVSMAATKLFNSEKSSYFGTYTIEDDRITAVDGDTLYFTLDNNKLIQTDSDGDVIAEFSRSK